VTDLRLVSSDQVPDAVKAVLEGTAGPFTPLPDSPTEADRWVEVVRPDQPVEEPDVAVVVPTSGSTGNARAVVLTRSALTAGAMAAHDRLGGPGAWVCSLAPHHVAGLMVHVRAYLSGYPAVTVDQQLTGLADVALPDAPAYISLVPTQLYKALRQAEIRTTLRRYTVLLGGAAADRAELERAKQAGIHVVTTYGMTETCGGVVYDGSPLDGVHIGLDDDGRISLSGPTTFSGYRFDPAASTSAWTTMDASRSTAPRRSPATGSILRQPPRCSKGGRSSPPTVGRGSEGGSRCAAGSTTSSSPAGSMSTSHSSSGSSTGPWEWRRSSCSVCRIRSGVPGSSP